MFASGLLGFIGYASLSPSLLAWFNDRHYSGICTCSLFEQLKSPVVGLRQIGWIHQSVLVRPFRAYHSAIAWYRAVLAAAAASYLAV